MSSSNLYAEQRPTKMRSPDTEPYFAVNPQYDRPSATGELWYL